MAKGQIVIVGAGIIGLAHALTALEGGWSVTVLEKDGRALGASVRNFGTLWPIGCAAGPEREQALFGVRRWQELAAPGIGTAFFQMQIGKDQRAGTRPPGGAGLVQNQRLAILLCRQDELSYEEIARVLGCSVSATKSLIHRGRETLKQKLKPYLQTGAW